MKTVHFAVHGSFSDNLIQYFAAEIIKNIYSYDEVKPVFRIDVEMSLFTDNEFNHIISKYLEGEIFEIDTNKDIVLWGNFERSDIFKKERHLIKSLFNVDNNNNISNRIKICNICKYVSKQEHIPTKNDLTLHVSFGSDLYSPESIIKIIKEISYDKLYIVSDSPANDTEREYLSKFNELNPIIINGNLGDNFDFILKSNNIITTDNLSWMGALLSEADKVYMIKKRGSQMDSFDDTICTVYENVDIWPQVKQ